MKTTETSSQTPATTPLTKTPDPAYSPHLAIQLVEKLAESSNSEAILAEANLSIPEGVKLLRRPAARKQFAFRKELGTTHTKILAHKYAPSMATRLIELANSKTEIISLKAASEVLLLSGLKKTAAAITADANKPPALPRNCTAEEKELQQLFTQCAIQALHLRKEARDQKASDHLDAHPELLPPNTPNPLKDTNLLFLQPRPKSKSQS